MISTNGNATTGEPKKDETGGVEKGQGSGKNPVGELLYGAVKALGGTALKFVNKLRVEGEENVPAMGKAILFTVSENPLRDMVAIAQVTGRKVQFMVNPKLMKTPVVGPLLKTLGMFRSTTSKDDTEPVQMVFKILNEDGNLVAMTPEARLGREVVIKSVAAILKFAVATGAPVVPLAISTEHEPLLGGLLSVPRYRIVIGEPVQVPKKFNRDKFREERYQRAEELVDLVEGLRSRPPPGQEQGA
ncbi:MAG: hypothetical protein Kow0069_33440 [Promethearchaeota archaeon]